jgi:hypothetical protein
MLVVLPVTPLRLLLRKSVAATPPCPPELRSFVVRPGRETYQLTISDSGSPTDAFRMKVVRERFKRRLNAGDWVRDGFLDLHTPVTVFRAWPINLPTSGEVRFYVNADVSDHMYETVHVCVDVRSQILLADAPFHPAVSFNAIPR